MKIFEHDGKINFVDENNVFLGYDMSQQCCEMADWFISDHLCNDVEDGTDYCVDGYVFDTNYFKEVGSDNHIIVFRIVKGDSEKFIHLYNIQNGYYSHGFEFKNEKEKIKDGYI